jgi:hypothetical protein
MKRLHNSDCDQEEHHLSVITIRKNIIRIIRDKCVLEHYFVNA